MKKITKIATITAALTLAACGAQNVTDNATEEVSSRSVKNYAEMQSALNGYLNTHKIAPTDIKEGLTISWVSANKGHEIWGYMIATGLLNESGCPVFDVVRIENEGRYGSRRNFEADICLD